MENSNVHYEEAWRAVAEQQKLIHGAVKSVGRTFGIYTWEDLVLEASIVFVDYYLKIARTKSKCWEDFVPQVYRRIQWHLQDLRRRELWLAAKVDHSEIKLSALGVSEGGIEINCIMIMERCITNRERQLVKAHWIQGRALSRISKEMNIPIRTLRHCRQQLKNRLIQSSALAAQK